MMPTPRRTGAEVAAGKRREIARLVAEGADAIEIEALLRTRDAAVLHWHLGGFTHERIAEKLELSSANHVTGILHRPEMQYLKRWYLARRQDASIRGEFGMTSALLAAGPDAVEKLKEKAGIGPAGATKAAEKDADQIRAAVEIKNSALKLVGANRQAGAQLMSILRDFTPDELETLKREKKFPARYVPILKQLGYAPETKAS